MISPTLCILQTRLVHEKKNQKQTYLKIANWYNLNVNAIIESLIQICNSFCHLIAFIALIILAMLSSDYFYSEYVLIIMKYLILFVRN